MVALIGCYVFWLWECVNGRERGGGVGFLGGGPECVSGGDGEEDECYTGPVG
jgi:hypothetical protein